MRSFHAVRSAPVSTSSLAAARRICVCPIFPQPPGIRSKLSFLQMFEAYPGCNRDCRHTNRLKVGGQLSWNSHNISSKLSAKMMNSYCTGASTRVNPVHHQFSC